MMFYTIMNLMFIFLKFSKLYKTYHQLPTRADSEALLFILNMLLGLDLANLPLEPLLQPKTPTLALSAPAVVPSIQQSSALY
jgi:hypothetical protein